MTFNPQTDEDKEVSQFVDRLFGMYVDRDLDGVLSCYVPDLVVIPQGDPIFGLEEYREVLAASFGDFDVLKMVYKPQQITISDRWAWEWHLEWSTLKRNATGETSAYFIKGTQLLRRHEDGSWKVARYMYNFSPLEAGTDPDAHMNRVLAKVPKA